MAEPPVARILALLQADDLATAAKLAGDAIAAGDSHPLLFDARGNWRMRTGQYETALADFEHAVARAPGNPALHDSIARCLIALDRLPEAIAACDRALAIEPRFAPAHFDKGSAAEGLGDLVLAERCYLQAETLDPAIAGAPARLAALATRRGDWAEAKALAETSLAREPGNDIATFAYVTASIAGGATDGLAERLRRVLSNAALPPQNRATALNLLGDVFDREDRIAQAFDAYASANATLRDVYAPRFAAGETGLARVLRLKDAFARIDPASWQTAVPSNMEAPATGHVFVLGFYRTGTTLLGQILAAHPAMVTLEEKPVLIDAAGDFLDGRLGLGALATIGQAHADRYRALYWKRVRKAEPGIDGKIVVDKLPLNSIALPVISKLFPRAKIVFALRDPRDVVFSCFRRLLNVNRDTYEMLDLETGATFYAAVMALAASYRATLPLSLLEVRNEALASDFEPRVRAICAFLGVGWEASMLRFAEQSRTRPIATPSSAQVARGINADGVGQWRRYSSELSATVPILAHWVDRFGYPAK
ncbi:MAG TPA: sulfotransferase [Rhizomicrobium sp.]|jgi:tetratricopeptide (TPR) repeat protein|nr:sulfotransferase [Rhizomicrobium sp.]